MDSNRMPDETSLRDIAEAGEDIEVFELPFLDVLAVT
jgi:hypothetical protein